MERPTVLRCLQRRAIDPSCRRNPHTESDGKEGFLSHVAWPLGEFRENDRNVETLSGLCPVEGRSTPSREVANSTGSGSELSVGATRHNVPTPLALQIANPTTGNPRRFDMLESCFAFRELPRSPGTPRTSAPPSNSHLANLMRRIIVSPTEHAEMNLTPHSMVSVSVVSPSVDSTSAASLSLASPFFDETDPSLSYSVSLMLDDDHAIADKTDDDSSTSNFSNASEITVLPEVTQYEERFRLELQPEKCGRRLPPLPPLLCRSVSCSRTKSAAAIGNGGH